MIFKPEKPDFFTIDKYIAPRARHLHDLKVKKTKDIIYILLCSLILTGLYQKVASSVQVHISWVKTVEAQKQVLVKDAVVIKEPFKDTRIAKLEAFLKQKESPLIPYASFIIEQSDKAGIDWTLITAIAGKESTYGNASRCYNAWGLGGRSFMCFKSWNESIAFEANLLGQNYRGNAVSGIQAKYCPYYECASDWTDFVVGASNEMLASQ